jgi:hypothetical protein
MAKMRKILKYAILGSMPLVGLTASAAQELAAGFSVVGVPDGALVRDCATHLAFFAIAFPVDGSLGNPDTSISCSGAQASGSGTTVESRPCTGSTGFHHRVAIKHILPGGSTETLCQGVDHFFNPPRPFSDGWDSVTTSTPWMNTTDCTLAAGTMARHQFSTDGGKHYGSCDSNAMSAASFGGG